MGLAGALVLSLAIPQAVAKPGGILVDDDATCEEPNRQDNSLSGEGIVWLNTPTLDGDYTYVILDNGEVVDEGSLDFEPCEEPFENWYFAEFDVDASELPGGTLTIVVFQDDPFGIVGNDSFRVIAA
jgi:hypothetical protein